MTKPVGFGSVATSAAWLATASWLARSFATASWLATTCWLAAVVVMLLEHLREQAFQATLRACARIAAVVNDFATANWLARSFATASWLSRSFATASWLATAGWLAAVVAVLVEQTVKKTTLLRSASGVTSACWLATASWLAGCFATASRLAGCFAATCWLYVTTRVTALVTQFVKQAERASVG